MKLVNTVTKLAEEKGYTIGQIAIGWVVALSRSKGLPTIVPIPGASQAGRVRENAKAAELKLTTADLAEINGLLSRHEIKGDRYPAFTMKYLDG